MRRLRGDEGGRYTDAIGRSGEQDPGGSDDCLFVDEIHPRRGRYSRPTRAPPPPARYPDSQPVGQPPILPAQHSGRVPTLPPPPPLSWQTRVEQWGVT